MARDADRVFEEWLLLQSQAGDAQALGLLISRWNARIVRHAKSYTGDMESAKDVAQESWIAIVRNLATVRDPAVFGAWARRITGRKAIDWVRKSKRMRDNAQYHAETLYPKTDDNLEGQDRVTVMRRAMRELSEAHRYTLTLFYLEGYTIREIAQIMDQPVGTIKARLFHAREHLKKKIKQQSHETST